MKHFETVRYRVQPTELSEVIVALLAEEGFDGFLEESQGWTIASRLENPNHRLSILEVISTLPGNLEWSSERIPEQNWNASWEASFPIIDIGDAIRIRAPFHEKGASNREEFELEPDMAFGTGHHPTTFLMAEALRTRSAGKTCLDFGTGTGILTMVMLRFGALHVTAIDNDERAVQTAARHIATEKGGLERSCVVCSSTLPDGHFDVIAANIHLNVIVEKLPAMYLKLNSGGQILVSGILEHQEKTLVLAAQEHGFLPTFKQTKEGWVCLALEKTK
jgi:ribosomal protein L11 methyltransferase